MYEQFTKLAEDDKTDLVNRFEELFALVKTDGETVADEVVEKLKAAAAAFDAAPKTDTTTTGDGDPAADAEATKAGAGPQPDPGTDGSGLPTGDTATPPEAPAAPADGSGVQTSSDLK